MVKKDGSQSTEKQSPRSRPEWRTDEELMQLLLEGMNSGEGIEATPEFWANLRRDVATRIAAHKQKHGRS